MRIGSLFSGIGGLELGLEWAELGETVWQVEQDEWCRSVLARRWRNAEQHQDICSLASGWLPDVDLICGGFPCQDVSSAGTRAGLAGKRSGLWRHYARIVKAKRPEWVVVENVASGATRWVDHVVRDLAELGYASLPVPVRADSLGAPYPRARIFIVARRGDGRLADPNQHLQHSLAVDAEVGRPPATHGVASRARQAADADRHELQLSTGWRRGACRAEAAQRVGYRWDEPMPPVDRVVPGSPRRVAAQRAGGNCVVPAQSEVAGWVVRGLMGETL